MIRTKRPHCLVEVVDDGFSGQPQSFTRLGERYPTRFTPEERHGQAFFQAFDLNADSRLGPVQRLGTTGDIPVSCHREEGAEQIGIETL